MQKAMSMSERWLGVANPRGWGLGVCLFVCLFAFFHYLSNTNILVTRGLCVTIQVKDFIFTCVANFRAYLGCI